MSQARTAVPRTLRQYRQWLADKLLPAFYDDKQAEFEDPLERAEDEYEDITSQIRNSFEHSEFWQQFSANYDHYNSEYASKNDYGLFLFPTPPKLLVKSFDSLINKTFRKNVLENPNRPLEPEEGWYLPNNWYEKINDIIRTRIIVKYLDGVELMTSAIASIAAGCSLSCESPSFEGKLTGYYAVHFIIPYESEISKVPYDTERKKSLVEIQIMTQLHESIERLLHKYYEEKRVSAGVETQEWYWNYASDQFAANYLGHILHYADGMVMNIRERQKRHGYDYGAL
jgi:ppGpp synthetase/RelA/SpoT-type nucleotidyltranferase